MAARQGNKAAKGSKAGRNKRYHEKRMMLGLELKNQIRRVKRHFKKYPDDNAAHDFLHGKGAI